MGDQYSYEAAGSWRLRREGRWPRSWNGNRISLIARIESGRGGTSLQSSCGLDTSNSSPRKFRRRPRRDGFSVRVVGASRCEPRPSDRIRQGFVGRLTLARLAAALLVLRVAAATSRCATAIARPAAAAAADWLRGRFPLANALSARRSNLRREAAAPGASLRLPAAHSA